MTLNSAQWRIHDDGPSEFKRTFFNDTGEADRCESECGQIWARWQDLRVRAAVIGIWPVQAYFLEARRPEAMIRRSRAVAIVIYRPATDKTFLLGLTKLPDSRAFINWFAWNCHTFMICVVTGTCTDASIRIPWDSDLKWSPDPITQHLCHARQCTKMIAFRLLTRVCNYIFRLIF